MLFGLGPIILNKRLRPVLQMLVILKKAFMGQFSFVPMALRQLALLLLSSEFFGVFRCSGTIVLCYVLFCSFSPLKENHYTASKDPLYLCEQDKIIK